MVDEQDPTPDYPWRNESRLKHLYLQEGRSIDDLAYRWSTSNSVVHKWLLRFNIPLRNPGPGDHIPELRDCSWMHEQYVGHEKNGREIAEELGVSRRRVYRWLEKHGIERRRPGPEPTRPELKDKQLLQELYLEKELGILRIAKRLGAHEGSVRNWLRYHGIKTRPPPGQFKNQKVACLTLGPNWKIQRQRALERDGYRCRVCYRLDTEERAETGKGLQVHHIRPRREFLHNGEFDHEAANRIENLMAVCPTCHGLLEGFTVRELVDVFGEDDLTEVLPSGLDGLDASDVRDRLDGL